MNTQKSTDNSREAICTLFPIIRSKYSTTFPFASNKDNTWIPSTQPKSHLACLRLSDSTAINCVFIILTSVYMN